MDGEVLLEYGAEGPVSIHKKSVRNWNEFSAYMMWGSAGFTQSGESEDRGNLQVKAKNVAGQSTSEEISHDTIIQQLQSDVSELRERLAFVEGFILGQPRA